ncbi:MAG: MotA/TolQ/ExbB proton channel family protein [Alphaproteobacteria bacterium]
MITYAQILEIYQKIYGQLGVMAIPLICCLLFASLIILERLFLIFLSFLSRPLKRIQKDMAKYKNLPDSLINEKISIHLERIRQKTIWGMGGLRLISSLAPTFGLLGTILGIIKAFQAISVHTGAVTPNLVAGGLWEAMLTTAVGLSISCFCQIFSFITHLFLNGWYQRVNIRVHQFYLNKDIQQYEIPK